MFISQNQHMLNIRSMFYCSLENTTGEIQVFKLKINNLSQTVGT